MYSARASSTQVPHMLFGYSYVPFRSPVYSFHHPTSNHLHKHPNPKLTTPPPAPFPSPSPDTTNTLPRSRPSPPSQPQTVPRPHHAGPHVPHTPRSCGPSSYAPWAIRGKERCAHWHNWTWLSPPPPRYPARAQRPFRRRRFRLVLLLGARGIPRLRRRWVVLEAARGVGNGRWGGVVGRVGIHWEMVKWGACIRWAGRQKAMHREEMMRAPRRTSWLLFLRSSWCQEEVTIVINFPFIIGRICDKESFFLRSMLVIQIPW